MKEKKTDKKETRTDLDQIRGRVSESFLGSISRDKDESVLSDLKNRMILSIVFAVPLLFVSIWPDLYPKGRIALEIIFLIPLIIVNHRVFVDGVTAIRHGNPEKNTLAALGSLVAIIMLQFEAAGVVLATMAVCRYCEAYIRLQLKTHLTDLIEKTPDDSELTLGEEIAIGTGETIPADGVVRSEAGSVDEILITGEKIPVPKKRGDAVYAGTVNAGGEIDIRVSRLGEDRVIDEIIHHIGRSLTTKAPMAAKAERVARRLVLAVIFAALVAGVAWGYFTGDIEMGATTAISVLIIASPYAFSASIPMVIQAAIIRGTEQGILIRSAKVLEETQDLNTVVLNKTGTITAGLPEISDVIPVTDEFDLRLAGALEWGADHPFGRTIYDTAAKEYDQIPESEMVESTSGLGLVRRLDGKLYYVGNSAYMHEFGISTEIDGVDDLFRQGKSLVFFADETHVIGIIALRDAPKPASLKAMSQIEGMGIDVVMVTGDTRETAEAIRYEMGIDHIFALVRAGEKKKVVQRIQEEKKRLVAMIGDGVKDAPAIKAASLGIAIATGKDIYIGPADIVLISDDLLDVVRAIRLSRITNRVLRQSIFLAWFYNILAVLAAGLLVPFAGMVMAPVAAALCMCASQVLIVLNPIRIRSREL